MRRMGDEGMDRGVGEGEKEEGEERVESEEVSSKSTKVRLCGGVLGKKAIGWAGTCAGDGDRATAGVGSAGDCCCCCGNDSGASGGIVGGGGGGGGGGGVD